MSFQDLAASDFPDLDPEKFDEWKALQIRGLRLPWIALAIMAGTAIVSVPLIGGGIGWMLPVIAYFAFMVPQMSHGRRLRQLTTELGMKERLKARRNQGKASRV
jgi:hypothetical protein